MYKRGLSTPLLKCLGKEEVTYAFLEVQKVIVGQYLGPWDLAKVIIRAGYFWLNMGWDAQEYLKNATNVSGMGMLQCFAYIALCSNISVVVHPMGIGHP